MGSVEPRTFRKFENGRMVTYSYAIHRDRNGSETHRTEPTALSSIGYDNGKPFREEDYNQIVTGRPRRGFWSRLFT
jgi:hypothetical protein